MVKIIDSTKNIKLFYSHLKKFERLGTGCYPSDDRPNKSEMFNHFLRFLTRRGVEVEQLLDVPTYFDHMQEHF